MLAPAALTTIANVGHPSTDEWVVSAGTARLLVDISWPGTKRGSWVGIRHRAGRYGWYLSVGQPPRDHEWRGRLRCPLQRSI